MVEGQLVGMLLIKALSSASALPGSMVAVLVLLESCDRGQC